MGGKTSTASRTKYNAKTYERLALNLRVDSPQSKKKIEAAAEREGVSVTAYVVEAVRRRMEQEKTPGGVVKNSKSELLTSEISSCLLSPEQEKALKDAVKDIVLDTSPNPEKRKMLKAELFRAVNETVDECGRMSRKLFYDGSLL
ncbi:MAG: hypothetical protein SOX94_04840 [Prevotella sp.]|nr:DUF1778 domain-containing protein [Faecalibacterium sp.]MDY4160818.1 hypothetical protein [Prevotella sp.]